MATAVLSPLFISISGKVGNFVFYLRNNKQCVRTYAVPRNPDTASQRNVRSSFADAVKSWQALKSEERYKYTRKARGRNMSGYNYFISEYMKEKISSGLNPQEKSSFPVFMSTCVLQRHIPSVSASIIKQISKKISSGKIYSVCGST